MNQSCQSINESMNEWMNDNDSMHESMNEWMNQQYYYRLEVVELALLAETNGWGIQRTDFEWLARISFFNLFHWETQIDSSSDESPWETSMEVGCKVPANFCPFSSSSSILLIYPSVEIHLSRFGAPTWISSRTLRSEPSMVGKNTSMWVD